MYASVATVSLKTYPVLAIKSHGTNFSRLSHEDNARTLLHLLELCWAMGACEMPISSSSLTVICYEFLNNCYDLLV